MVTFNNRLVNVWRGSDSPPTIYHIWIRDDTNLWLYDMSKEEWVAFMEYPGLTTSIENGKIKISSGNDYFYLTTDGDGLGINTNVANTITITSTALTNIIASSPLKWDSGTSTISHNESGVVAGTYGPYVDATNISTFTVPSITVDKYGHVINASTKSVSPAAIVSLSAILEKGVYPIALSPSAAGVTAKEALFKNVNLGLVISDSGISVNTPGINVSGNGAITGDLEVKGTIKGNIEGNVTGTATPTNHADATDKYGAGTAAGANGTAAMYGHVKLQDSFEIDDSGIAIRPESVSGVAASPRLVYDAMLSVLNYIDTKTEGVAAPSIEASDGTITKITTDYTFSNDFLKSDEKLYINWLEID